MFSSHRNRSRLHLLGLAALVAAAVGAPGCSAAVESDEVETAEDELVSSLSLTKVTTARTFDDLSIDGGGFGQAGRSMKFLMDNRVPARRTLNFINGNFKVRGEVPEFAKFHYFFAKKQLGVTDSGQQFNESTYFTSQKRFFAGTVQTYFMNGAQKPVFAIQFFPDDVINEEGILDAVKTVKSSFSIPGATMVFVATGPQQTTVRVAAQLRALGVEPLTIDAVLGSVNYFPMNPGEAFGVLRIFPKDSNALRPTDIPVFEELPLDLSVVSATITRTVQDVASHVNLKSKERGTPNMVLRDASPTNPGLASFADKPVHLVVTKGKFTLELSTDAIVEQKLREKLNKPLIKFPVVNEPNLFDYDAMCPVLSTACTQNGNRFGGKGAMLGFLANRSVIGRQDQRGTISSQLGYDVTPRGFAIPVQYYRDFVNAPENALLKSKLDALITKEKAGNLAPAERIALLKEVQQLFYVGKVPPAQLAAIQGKVDDMVRTLPSLEKIKVRSSANAEDIPNFDGAGLHDSFAARMDKKDNAELSCKIEPEIENGVVTKLEMKPKTVQCGIKGVYASLWNQRAIDERSFARLDHATAAMGIAIVPAYDTESEVAANGVLVTRMINSGSSGFTLSLQKGNNLVTNPAPGTISQTTAAFHSDGLRPTRFTTTRFATPKAGEPALTTPVLTDAQMLQLVAMAKSVEIAYCKAKPGYYRGDCREVWADDAKPSSLDMEFKLLENGEFVLKQSREFHGQ